MPPFYRPEKERGHKLTGRIRVRLGEEPYGVLGKRPVLVAQVEEQFELHDCLTSNSKMLTRWRDMRTTDLQVKGSIVEIAA